MQEEYEIYGGFASVYDEFMDNIPYNAWYEYLHGLLKEYGISDGIVVDIACGTGEITRRLSQDGYDMIGIDISKDMLNIARQKCDPDVLLLCQDMRQMDLYGTAKAMVCLCDGMNYLCRKEDLLQALQRVRLFMDHGGIFIFDMKTPYFYQDILGDRTITDNREDASYIWENFYDRDTRINEYLLTVYELADEERDLFVRTDEVHRQKAYMEEEVKKAIEESGMQCMAVYNAFTKDAPDEQTQRMYFVVRKE